MQLAKNAIIGWLYREIDLSGVTSIIWRFTVRPSESYDYLLERVQCRYFSDDADPSGFSNMTWRLELPPQDKNLQEQPVKIPLTLNMGLVDQTAGTTRPREYYFKSPKINWPVLSLEHFTIHLENFANVGTADFLFMGHFIMPAPVIRERELVE